MNSRPMILRFSSGSVTPASASRNRFGGVDDLEPHAGGGDVVALDLLGLALAQQAVVDEHAGELVADRPVHERRRDRGVDAAGQAADHPLVADLRADRGDLLVDDVGHRPRRRGSRRRRTGSARAPVWPCAVCRTSGWNCTPASAAAEVLERRDRRAVGRARDDAKPVGRARTPRRRALIHTDCSAGSPRNSAPVVRSPAAAVRPNSASPVCATVPPSAERHRLEAVADAEGRHARRRTAPGRPTARPRRRPTTARRTG